jgi:hypothetical protein
VALQKRGQPQRARSFATLAMHEKWLLF